MAVMTQTDRHVVNFSSNCAPRRSVRVRPQGDDHERPLPGRRMLMSGTRHAATPATSSSVAAVV